GVILPFNYQYELSSWIYKIISQVDGEYAHFLHQNGYESNKRSFKFFCFSNLHIPQYKVIRNIGFLLQTRQLEFQIGFYMDSAAEKFIAGLFQHQKGSIGTKEHQVDFSVQHIETIPIRVIEERIKLKTISPLVVTQRNERNNKDYIYPLDDSFKELLIRNLIEKYKATDQEIPPHWKHYPFVLEIADKENIRSKLVTIKQNTPDATHVRGYLFEFTLQAPKELLEIGLATGFGNENAQGFGMCEIVE
ncbi:MAG: CRISPR-associated endoribonuclease Cas6, partial [Flammeovirgaceae bacterium]|nr:CRISPR-associated endoribonuclease Cas6 [Flammeovirgaceae bacterium]MDW8287141.1 CRISPR-associated endoribonuclease Cas6 [Flammeovirgaceae bacterium]